MERVTRLIGCAGAPGLCRIVLVESAERLVMMKHDRFQDLSGADKQIFIERVLWPENEDYDGRVPETEREAWLKRFDVLWETAVPLNVEVREGESVLEPYCKATGSEMAKKSMEAAWRRALDPVA